MRLSLTSAKRALKLNVSAAFLFMDFEYNGKNKTKE